MKPDEMVPAESYEDVPLEDDAAGEPAPPSRGSPLLCACAVVLPFLIALVTFGSLLGHATHNSPIFKPQVAANASGPVRSGAELMRGVNLGGWLVLEPWITPSLFYQFLDQETPATDERTFCAMLGPAESRRQLEAFRDAWVTEETFAKLKRIGINTVRLPYGYWAYGDQSEFCPGVSSIEYVDKAVAWAEKHGLRVVLDLHGVPGSQNGFDNSGDSHKPPFGTPLDAHDWLSSENSQTAIDILTRVAARYANSSAVVQMGLVNEPIGFALSGFCKANCPIDQELLLAYYKKAWAAIRSVNKHVRPVLDVSFRNRQWAVLRGEKQPWMRAGAVLDTHRYHGWWPRGSKVPQVAHLRQAGCGAATDIRGMATEALPTVVGEWSLAVSDCMTFLNGVGLDSAFTHPAQCGRVRCPETFGKLPKYVGTKGPLPLGSRGGPDAAGMCPVDPLSAPPGPLGFDEFYTQFAAYAMSGYEASVGWTFWNFKSEVADPRWGFLDMYDKGWLPPTLDGWNAPVIGCDQADAGLPFDMLLMGTFASAAGLLVALFAAAAIVWTGGRCCSRHGTGMQFVKMQSAPSYASQPSFSTQPSCQTQLSGTHGAVELSHVTAPPVRTRIAADRPDLPTVSSTAAGAGARAGSPVDRLKTAC